MPGTGHQIKSYQIATETGERLEIRGTGLQSVLPPSPHPMTGGYRWLEGCSPDSVEVAIAPEWLLEVVNSQRNPPQNYEPRRINTNLIHRNWTNPPSQMKCCSTSVETALLLLEVIHPRFADDYQSWIRVGMALKFISNELLDAWDEWSQLSPKYQPGECGYKWQSFRGWGISERYLYWLATQSRLV